MERRMRGGRSGRFLTKYLRAPSLMCARLLVEDDELAVVLNVPFLVDHRRTYISEGSAALLDLPKR